MSTVIDWITAEAERPEVTAGGPVLWRRGERRDCSREEEFSERNSPAAQDSVKGPDLEELCDCDQERRAYRARTIAMLRRYMRHSLETGRLPSVLGKEFFRTKVTSYTVASFEDRVIFVHDMETSLKKLDGFSRELIARHILQEHDQAATGRLLGCTEKTVRHYVPVVLDLLSEILLEVGLLERVELRRPKSCQEGGKGQIFASDCEDGKYKV